MSGLTAVSLFAGVGGIDLALERAGVHVTAAVEINAAARGVIAQQRPDIALFDDVTKVTPDELRATGFVPERGILAGGFPCQDLSVAGRRAGLGGARSGLFWHIMRLADALRPRWLLLENVPGLLSSNDGRDMGTVVGAVAERGYGLAYRVLDARFFGVPQRRRRVFFVGHLGDTARPAQVLLEPESGVGDHQAGRQAGQGVAATLTSGTSNPGVPAPGRRQEDDVNLIVGTLTAKWAKGTGGPAGDETQNLIVGTLTASKEGGWRIGADDEAAAGRLVVEPTTFQKVVRSGERDANGDLPPEVWAHRPVAATLNCGDNTSESRATELILQPVSVTGEHTHALTSEGHDATEVGVRRFTPRECERLQGFPDGWTAVSNGKPQADSPRYQQMGNAVAVPVVEWIARRIVEASA